MRDADAEFMRAATAEVRGRSSEEHDLVIADVRIRIMVAGSSLTTWLGGALNCRLEPSSGAADAQLFVATGYPFPPPPWAADDYINGHRIRHLVGGERLATFDVERRILNMYDHATTTGMFWCHDVADLPDWEFGAPLRSLLTWVLRHRNIHLVHAAAVGEPLVGGVLLAGRGGSGKSTTTLACVAAGMATAGDDYCAVSGGHPNAYAIYGLAKVAPSSIAGSLVDLRTAHTPRADGKVHTSLGKSLCSELPLRAIVLPTVADRTGEPTCVSPRQALYRIAPNTMLQSELGGRELFAALAALVNSLPAYSLEVGPDLDRVVQTLRSLLT